MYVSIDITKILQGDIMEKFYFVTLPTDDIYISRKSVDNLKVVKKLNEVSDAYNEDKEIILVNSFTSKGMIVSQTCDIQRREWISICPVFSIDKMRQDLLKEGKNTERIESAINQVRSQKVNYYLYLPSWHDEYSILKESYVDLQMINSIPSVASAIF
jgi:hypothetical protein